MQEKFWPAFENRYNKNPELKEDFIKDYIFDTLKSVPSYPNYKQLCGDVVRICII